MPGEPQVCPPPPPAWRAGARLTLISGVELKGGGPLRSCWPGLASEKLGVGELGGFAVMGTKRLEVVVAALLELLLLLLLLLCGGRAPPGSFLGKRRGH